MTSSCLAPLQRLKMWKTALMILVTAARFGQYTVGTSTCVGLWLVACFYVQYGCYDTMQVACTMLNQRSKPAGLCCSLQFTECITPREQLSIIYISVETGVKLGQSQRACENKLLLCSCCRCRVSPSQVTFNYRDKMTNQKSTFIRLYNLTSHDVLSPSYLNH